MEYVPSMPDIGEILDAIFIGKELPLANIPTNLEVYQLHQFHVN